jgi:adenylylsulfate kinase
MRKSFAIAVTGLPASGKSTLTAVLVRLLAESSIVPAVLESDELRKILMLEGDYSQEARDRFYRQLTDLGGLLVRRGIPVILDATASRRQYRDRARSLIPRYLEVYIDCPLPVCRSRDPKGIYAAAAEGRATTVPGLQVPYEPPISPEVMVDCREDPVAAARRIIEKLRELEYL